MFLKFAERCPSSKRGRPMSMSPAAAEAAGYEVCEKTTRDGRVVAYKTGVQLEKERIEKRDRRYAREKIGALRGRLSKINKEKFYLILEELRSLRESAENQLESKLEEGHKEMSSMTDGIEWDKNGAIISRPESVKKEIAAEIHAEIARLKRGGTPPLGVLHGDDPKRQKELNEKVAPRPDRPERYKLHDVVQGIKKAYRNILREHPLRVSPQFHEVYNELRKFLPGLTKQQFKDAAKLGREREELDFYHVNSPDGVVDSDLGIYTPFGSIYYLAVRS